MTESLEQRRAKAEAYIDDRFSTRKAFAEAVGKDPSTISKSLNPDKTSEGRVHALEEAITRLQEGPHNGDEPPSATRPNPSAGASVVEGLPEKVQQVHVPVFGDAGAGPGRFPLSDEVERYATVPVSEFVQRFQRYPEDENGIRGYGFFEITGRSAAPFYFDGELVPVQLLPEPTQEFKDDVLYVYRWQSHFYMKVLRSEGERVEARSLNPSMEPRVLEPGEQDDFAVIARVIETEKQQIYGAMMERFLRLE